MTWTLFFCLFFCGSEVLRYEHNQDVELLLILHIIDMISFRPPKCYKSADFRDTVAWTCLDFCLVDDFWILLGGDVAVFGSDKRRTATAPWQRLNLEYLGITWFQGCTTIP